MVRPSRSTLHWLLWLVIALLPLRGWAMAQMAVAAPVTPSVAAHQMAVEGSHHHAATTPDCPTQPATTHAGCSLCVVCHAGLAPAVMFDLALPVLPHTPPAAAPPAGIPDGPPAKLFRPPRRRLG